MERDRVEREGRRRGWRRTAERERVEREGRGRGWRRTAEREEKDCGESEGEGSCG